MTPFVLLRGFPQRFFHRFGQTFVLTQEASQPLAVLGFAKSGNEILSKATDEAMVLIVSKNFESVKELLGALLVQLLLALGK